MEHVYLMGTEQVQSAASSMRAAAEEMKSAASSIDWSLQQHRQWADQWLADFRMALEEHAKAMAQPLREVNRDHGITSSA